MNKCAGKGQHSPPPNEEVLRAVHLAEYPLLMDVVLAAHDVLDHLGEGHVLLEEFPYDRLRAALDKLAKGVEPNFHDLQRELHAACYRWLRKQHWDSSRLAVVENPREAVKLGHHCPFEESLDEIVINEMAKESKWA